jgi:dTDP-4-dehydrorhamnose 3,5-epimerase
MRFTPTDLDGVVLIDPEPRHDARGSFARRFSADAMRERGLDPTIAQCSIAYNVRRGTLRGLHFQHDPHAESKIMCCVRGALFAVAADIRPASATFGRHVAVELAAADRRSMYVPKGFAVGYQTLADDTEIMYEISVPHAPGHEGGIHHADPTLGIRWPLPVAAISERDTGLPGLDAVVAR